MSSHLGSLAIMICRLLVSHACKKILQFNEKSFDHLTKDLKPICAYAFMLRIRD